MMSEQAHQDDQGLIRFMERYGLTQAEIEAAENYADEPPLWAQDHER